MPRFDFCVFLFEFRISTLPVQLGVSMKIFPAIDIRDGRCVRLRQGDYAQETIFGDDPAAMARRWVDEGADRLHIVDLDGAKLGRPSNGVAIRRIVEATGVPCQLGGGLRTEADIQLALSWGVERVVIGTRAVREPDWLANMSQRFPGKIVLGIDAKQGMVATEGWLQVSETTAVGLAQQCSALPLAALVYTDIARDGMMQGPNLEAMRDMAQAVSLPVIASGGVSKQEDVRNLMHTGVFGVIIGRALYEEKIDLREVLKMVRKGD